MCASTPEAVAELQQRDVLALRHRARKLRRNLDNLGMVNQRIRSMSCTARDR
jgi:hypothetical protein